MTKFSNVPFTSGLALADYIMAVTAAGVDQRQTLQDIVTLFQTSGKFFWNELGRSTALSTSVTLSQNIASKKYLMLLYELYSIGGGTVNARLNFNTDTAANYASRSSANGAADTTAVSQTSLVLDAGASQSIHVGVAFITNIASQEKIITWHSSNSGTAGAANAPNHAEGAGKWANTTNAISYVALNDTGGSSWGTGSEMVILGHD